MENTARTASAAAYDLGESIRTGVNSAMESAGRSVNRLQDSFTGEHAKKSMKETSDHLGSIASANRVLYEGFQEVSREWTSFAKARGKARQSWFSEIVACRTPHDLFEIQTRLWMNNMETSLASSQRIAEISTGVAKKATMSMVPAVTTLQ